MNKAAASKTYDAGSYWSVAVEGGVPTLAVRTSDKHGSLRSRVKLSEILVFCWSDSTAVTVPGYN